MNESLASRLAIGLVIATAATIASELILWGLVAKREKLEPAAPVIVPVPVPAPSPTPEPKPRPRPRPFREETL